MIWVQEAVSCCMICDLAIKESILLRKVKNGTLIP
jgi:hypothetical protein